LKPWSSGATANESEVDPPGQLGILPMKFQLQGQYRPVNPSVFGQRWNIQVAITPVIPKLIKGNILEDW
jgi:hypothetical protein